MIPRAKWGLLTTSAALLIAACFMAGLADATGSEEALGRHLRADGATTEILDQEDITEPSVKSSWVGKFDKAKHDHASHKTAGYWMDTSSGSDSGSTSKKRAITPKHNRSIIAPDPKKLSPAAKAKMIAKMKALRESIMSDFKTNIKTEKRADCSFPYPAASCAGYAPPANQ